MSVSLGLGLVFDRSDAQGGSGHSALVAGTARANLGGSGKARVFFGEYDYVRQGRFRIVPGGDGLPPKVERGRYLGQEWARSRGQRRIAGLLLDTDLGGSWAAGATAIFSQEDPTRAFSQFFRNVGGTGMARSIVVASPQQRATAWSGEVRAIGRIVRAVRTTG